MPADYSSYKPVFGDTENYPAQINAFIDAVQEDMNSKVDASVAVYKSIISKAADYAVGPDDYTIEIDCTISDVTITLPAAEDSTGRLLVFRRTDQSVYRALVGTVYELFNQNEFVTLQSNGVDWVRVG